MSAIDPFTGLPANETLARRAGMTAWGVLLIVLGAIAALAAVASLFEYLRAVELVLLRPPDQSAGSPAPEAFDWTTLVGMLLMLVVGPAIVWTGIGCCLGRRWVRPVIVIASGLLIALGLFVLIAYALNLPSMLNGIEAARQGNRAVPSPFAFLLVYAIRGLLLIAVMVVLPWVALRFFLDRSTRQALDLLDSRTLWTDRRPLPVLGWAALCALVGISALARIAAPALPAFTMVLKGAPAIAGLAAIGVLLAWGAWLCIRMDRLGWIITFILLAGLRVSTAVYLWGAGDPKELMTDAATTATFARLQQIGIPPDWLPKVMATLEALVVIVFGLIVAQYFPRRYQVGVLRAGEPVEE